MNTKHNQAQQFVPTGTGRQHRCRRFARRYASLGDYMGRTIAIITAMLLLTSCAIDEGPPYYQSIPPLSQVPGVGVSFVIPDEEGWAFFDPDGKGSAIVKSGKTKIESYVISLDYFRQSSLKTEGEFRDIYERLKRGETEGSRYRARVVEDELENLNGKYAINFYYLVEDSGAIKLPSNSQHMMLETMGIFTVDPNKPDTLLRIAYTYRYAPGNEDPNFKEKAKWVLDHVRFTQ